MVNENSTNEENLHIPPVTTQEVIRAVKLSKNGRAPGPGNIYNELIKSAPIILYEILAKMYDKCLKGDIVPREWKTAIITSLYKKGNRKDCSNYRGISVMPSLARLYGRILKDRIEREVKDSEEQNGFRPGRSCIDGIFTLRNLIEKRVCRGLTTHLAFVDLHKAYDTVPQNKLWTSLYKNGVSTTYVRAVKEFYSNCMSMVKIGNKVSSEFLVTKGLRQGCTMAPTLFKIYLEEALGEWKRKCSGMGIPVGGEIMYTLLFADDQVIVAGDMDDLSYMLRKLKDEYEKWGLKINMSKTEYLKVGDDELEDIEIETEKIKGCKTFKYLGVTLSCNGKSSDDINNKIGQGKRAIRQLNPILWNDKIKKRTKQIIYSSVVESITTYGAEVWELNKRERDRLLALEMDFWRRSSGISKLEHVRNERIRDIMGVKRNIIDKIETKRLLWYGHLERMEEFRWPKLIWKWIPPERRKRGRPPRSWAQDVQDAMAARGLQEGDWDDREKWRSGSEMRRQP